MPFELKRAAALLATTACFVAPTGSFAMTVTETTDFSEDADSPTALDLGTTAVTGTVDFSESPADRLDAFRFQDLAAGENEFHFELISGPNPITDFNDNGRVRLVLQISENDKFDTGESSVVTVFDETFLGTRSGTFTTSSDFQGGDLTVAVGVEEIGPAGSYSIGRKELPAVPLPASALLLAGGIAGLGSVGAAKRRRAKRR